MLITTDGKINMTVSLTIDFRLTVLYRRLPQVHPKGRGRLQIAAIKEILWLVYGKSRE